MKNYELDSEKEEKNKKKGLLITMFFHIGALLLAFFPLMGAIEDISLTENVVQMVEIDNITIENDVEFVDNVEDEARKGDSMDDSKSIEVDKKPEPTPAPEPQPEPKPIDVVDDNEAPVVPTGDNPKATEIPNNEAPKTDPKTDPTPTPTNPSGKNPSDENKPGGNSTKPGVSGDGGDSDDLQEGVFGRRVMKRPNIKGLTKKKGRIAIKVCVSQEGTVIATKFLDKSSTIYEAKLIASAMRAARRYKFDVDYTAPKKQWGKLTFVFDL